MTFSVDFIIFALSHKVLKKCAECTVLILRDQGKYTCDSVVNQTQQRILEPQLLRKRKNMKSVIDKKAQLQMFATCSKGLESVLEKELNSAGIKTTISVGGISFSGSHEEMYLANIWSRTASQVLLILKKFPCHSKEDLYKTLLDYPFEKFLTPKDTFAFQAVSQQSQLDHSHFIELTAKDALADRFREKYSKRPNVSAKNPDFEFFIRMYRNQAILAFNTSGEKLHKRGLGKQPAFTSLKESLAAGVIQLSKPNFESLILDPMCGSGTFLTESALIATNYAPGLLRKHFAFMKLKDFNSQLWEKILHDAKKKILIPPNLRIIGMDISENALQVARKNIQKHPLAKYIDLKKKDFFVSTAPENHGTIFIDPPYGEKTKDASQLSDFYKRIGNTLKQKYSGFTANIIASDLSLIHNIGLKSEHRISLYNSALKIYLMKYSMY